jgi:hypothetical protein
MTSLIRPCTRTDSRYVLPAKFLREVEKRNPPGSYDRYLAEGNLQLPYGREEIIENALYWARDGPVSRNNLTVRILPYRTHRWN